MTAPILVLCVLFLPLQVSWVIGGRATLRSGAVLGVSCAILFFGVGHFAQTEAMVDMLPKFVPLAVPVPGAR